VLRCRSKLLYDKLKSRTLNMRPPSISRSALGGCNGKAKKIHRKNPGKAQVSGHTTDFRQRVESLEVDHAPTTEVGPKDDFGLKVLDHAREHDVVFKVRS
jgi:hypothetical protein